MIEIRPMDEGYIHVDCLHHGPVDPSSPPTRGREWQDAPRLPPHPWSDETVAELARQYRRISEGWAGDPAREFMREMIQRHGTCAMLAWEDGKVVGHLRFYPLTIAQLLFEADPKKHRLLADAGVTVFEPDPETLWVLCVMTSRPYVGPQEGEMGGKAFPSSKAAGARRGRGQKLVAALISWAGERGWKRIVKQAHADLDCMYGIFGGGGKAFWLKAGFKVVGRHYNEMAEGDPWHDTAESQAQAKGMSKQEAWTWYHMAYDL